MADIISPSLSSIEKANIVHSHMIIFEKIFSCSDLMHFLKFLIFFYYLFLILEFIFVKFYAKIVYALGVTFFNLAFKFKFYVKINQILKFFNVKNFN